MRVGDLVRRTAGPGADGQLGRIVELDDGVWMVRLNRAAQEMLVTFDSQHWSLASSEPLTKMQEARIAYGADVQLRHVLGEYAVPDWISLRDSQRAAWMNGPPKGAVSIRRRLYEAIILELRMSAEADE